MLKVMSALTKRGRGRPRPKDTIHRDEQLLLILQKGPLTREEIAEHLGVNLNIAYLALDRLKRQGKVAKTVGSRGDARAYTWELVVD